MPAARKSCTEATPSSLAVNRLSSCSRELIRPLARKTPDSSISTAYGNLLIWNFMPSSVDSRYGNRSNPACL
ncbi:hypothetical protein G6F64_015501 [Rhizopus arrhizus]|uniref:Uncharacterized protein n=1 Tax=Rhizopus oryzae TaxID=64495 RepID=A0A9P6WR90_RHIOR|nr:hypothetical protein G6F64_015501 [Rhizopus arrhizus]